jgi:hypothetical protein
MSDKLKIECFLQAIGEYIAARQDGEAGAIRKAAEQVQREYDRLDESEATPPTDAQLTRLRETLRPTIEDWARDYGLPWGKEHDQLENRLVAALVAMHTSGTITINNEAERPEGGL